MLSTRITLAATLVLAGAARPVAGQTGTPRFDEPARSRVIGAVVRELERAYVEADTARLIGAIVAKKAAAGGYGRLSNPAQFADAVTEDLRSLNGDLHLGLRYSPPDAGAERSRTGPPPRPDFGLTRAEILDGNVGYLEIAAFAGAPGYREAVADALRFLARTDALIIDVRRNGGGSGEMSHLVFSHFLPAEPTPTITVRRRAPAEPEVRRSMAEVPGPRRTEVPLYVLTSRGTGSAAEEFSFVLKNLKRATIVGSRTAGAGHMVAGVPVGDGFVLSVSITRVSDPVTGKEWEGVGVTPDHEVPVEQALVAAHRLALRTILARGPDPARARSIARIDSALAASVETPAADPRLLAKWVGSYGGRVITATSGGLGYARRVGALSEPLIALDRARFALGAVRFAFEEKDGTPWLTIEQADGTQLTFPRDADRP